MDATTLQSLTATLVQNLNISSTDLLSALDTFNQEHPHPYNRLKDQYFSPDHKFSTLDDINVPDDFNMYTCMQTLTSISSIQQEIHDQHRNCLENHAEHEHIGNCFASHDGEKFVVNHDRIKKYIELHEIVNNIPANYVTAANCREVAQKILTHYTSIWNS